MSNKWTDSIKRAIQNSTGHTKNQRIFSYLTWTAIGVAVIGSIMSALGVCTGGCTDAEKYRFMGMQFATVGIPFFLLLAAASFGRNSDRSFIRFFYDTMLPGAAGAEWFFIVVQSRFLKHYCPICLTIACAVFVAVAVRLVEIYMRRRERPSPGKRYKNIFMTSAKAVVALTALYAGLIVGIVGTSYPVAVAGSGEITHDIWLGNADSNVDVLIVSDWFCSYCREVEPTIEKMLPAIEKVARYSFIDDPIHKESLNFIPANMSLLLNSKANYHEGRKVLLELAGRNKSPSSSEITNALQKHGISLIPADSEVLDQVTKSEAGFIRANAVTMTPTVVVRNNKTGARGLLVGSTEITEEKLFEMVKNLGD